MAIEIVGGSQQNDQVILKLSKEGKDGSPCAVETVGIMWHGQHFLLKPGQGCKVPRDGAMFIIANAKEWEHNGKIEVVELDAKEAKSVTEGAKSEASHANSVEKRAVRKREASKG